MITKYYLKQECNHPHARYNDKSDCLDCESSGFTRGADVTELIERVFGIIEPTEHLSDDAKEHLEDLIEVVEDEN